MATIKPTNPISIKDYNNLHILVDNILGVGIGDLGYGNIPLSTLASTGTTITSFQWNNLVTDVEHIRRHQLGNTYTIATDVFVRDVHYTDIHGLVSNTTLINTATITILQSELAHGVVDRLSLGELQSTGTPVYSPNLSNWTGRKTHSVRIDFGTEDAARNFFNAGGEFSFEAALTGLPLSPGHSAYTWSILLAGSQSDVNDTKYGMGRVVFGRTNTALYNGVTGEPSIGPGVLTAAVGWINLREGVQTQLFYQSVKEIVAAAESDLAGSTDPTHIGYYMYHSAYQYQYPLDNGSYYKIDVTKVSPHVIEFLMVFHNSINPLHTIEEPIPGTLNSAVIVKHATGYNVQTPFTADVIVSPTTFPALIENRWI